MGLPRVTVVGGGLAGCECALALAARGIPVELHEMRPETMSPAHHTGHLAELVCSNSLKATRIDSAAGLLKVELERMGSALLSCAREAAVPRRRRARGRPGSGSRLPSRPASPRSP